MIDDIKKKAEKEAFKTPEQEREQKIADNLLKSAKGQKKAAKDLSSAMDKARAEMEKALDSKIPVFDDNGKITGSRDLTAGERKLLQSKITATFAILNNKNLSAQQKEKQLNALRV